MLKKLLMLVTVIATLFTVNIGWAKSSYSPLMQELITGNTEFVAGNLSGLTTKATPAVRKSLALGQAPKVIVLDCSDSRLTPEIIFNKGLGDLFVVRVAGNVIAPHQIASIEYAIEHLKAEAIVIMGHERCGAVSAAMSYVTPAGDYVDPNSPPQPLTPDLQTLVLTPSLKAAVVTTKNPATGSNITNDCILENVRNVYKELVANTLINAELTKAGSIFEVNEAFYDLDDGKVTFTRVNGTPVDVVYSLKGTVNNSLGGSIAPGDAGVAVGGSQTFTVNVNPGYLVAGYNLTTSGGTSYIPGAVSSITLGSVSSNQVIAIDFVADPGPVVGATLNISSTGVNQVTLSASATGGSGNYEYQFLKKNLDGSYTPVSGAYSTSPTWVWDTTSAALGSYVFAVYVRNAGTTVPFDVRTFKGYNLALNPVTAATLSISPTGPNQLTLSAAVTAGGSGSYEYQFLKKNPDGSYTPVSGAYGPSSTWVWDTTSAASGSHVFAVYIRNAGTSVLFDVRTFKGYTLP